MRTYYTFILTALLAINCGTDEFGGSGSDSEPAAPACPPEKICKFFNMTQIAEVLGEPDEVETGTLGTPFWFWIEDANNLSYCNKINYGTYAQCGFRFYQGTIDISMNMNLEWLKLDTFYLDGVGKGHESP